MSDIPLPVPTPDNEPFYTAARDGQLVFQRCLACRRYRHPPRPICPACLSPEHEWQRSPGRGTVWTWTIVRGPTLPAVAANLPYNVVDVLMDEGVHFVSQIIDCSPEDLRAGLPVEAVFIPASPDITLVKFRRLH
jgi:uncharacterized protein